MSGPLHVVPGPLSLLWLGAGAALIAGGVALFASSQHDHETRVAIRVDCSAGVGCPLAESLALDVWSENRSATLPLDVVVPKSALADLEDAGASFVVLEADIDAVAHAEAERLAVTANVMGGDWFAEFRDYRAIEQHLQELAEQYPQRASLHGIGTSLDGRTLWALRVGGAHDDDLPMLINGTQHAREWIAAMTATCVADRLVTEYDSDPAIRTLVDSTEVWLVPVVNPDGYQYSWGQDRYWRKNRSGGHGVDLNRNFSVA